MAFDGVFLHTITMELQQLVNARINKIYQPSDTELIFIVRSNKENKQLLLSAHSEFSRIQFTNRRYTYPDTPSNFVMLLRRYLEGNKISSVEQIENDRILKFKIISRNELGDLVDLSIIIEFMGRHSNIFLLDENDTIIDLIKRIPPSKNTVRNLLPGQKYSPLKNQTKLNPFKIDFKYLVNDYLENDINEFTSIVQRKIQGLDLMSAKYLSKYISDEKDHFKAFNNWFNKFDTVTKPNIYLDNDTNKLNYAAIEYTEEIKKEFKSLSELLDYFYFDQKQQQSQKSQAFELSRFIKNELLKYQKKLDKLNNDSKKAESAENYEQIGNLLITYGSNIKKGTNQISLKNYYDNNNEILINLDPKLDGISNANKYFNKYRKLKASTKYIQEQIELTNKEIDYFSSLNDQIEFMDLQDIVQVKEELISEGYLKKQHNKQKTQNKKKKINLQQIVSSTGIVIEVGKNNIQNDYLSLKKSKKTDIWLHVKGLPGSHVVIHDDNPDETTLLEAANLASYFSKARESANVGVDYLPIKNLRKPNGAKPGFVIFENQKTLYVTPDKDLILKLLQKSKN